MGRATQFVSVRRRVEHDIIMRLHRQRTDTQDLGSRRSVLDLLFGAWQCSRRHASMCSALIRSVRPSLQFRRGRCSNVLRDRFQA